MPRDTPPRPPRVAMVLKRSGEGRIQIFYNEKVLVLEVKTSDVTGGWEYSSEDGNVIGHVNSRAEAIAQGVAELIHLNS